MQKLLQSFVGTKMTNILVDWRRQFAKTGMVAALVGLFTILCRGRDGR